MEGGMAFLKYNLNFKSGKKVAEEISAIVDISGWNSFRRN
jgi:hypothetical protein